MKKNLKLSAKYRKKILAMTLVSSMVMANSTGITVFAKDRVGIETLPEDVGTGFEPIETLPEEVEDDDDDFVEVETLPEDIDGDYEPIQTLPIETNNNVDVQPVAGEAFVIHDVDGNVIPGTEGLSLRDALPLCPTDGSETIIEVYDDFSIDYAYVPIVSGQNITIRPADGVQKTITQTTLNRHFEMKGGTLTLDNIRLLGSGSYTEAETGTYISDESGGIQLNDGAGTDAEINIINGSVIENCTDKGHGGGVYVNTSTDAPTINVFDSSFINNGAYEGGAIGVYDSVSDANRPTITIDNSTFTGNLATSYGGAIRTFNTDLNITDSTFTENIGSYNGGAIWVQENCVTNIDNTVIDDNYSSSGGAIYGNGSDLTITNSEINNNEGHGTGGALSFFNCKAFIDNCDINNNTGGQGGAMKIYDNSEAEIQNTRINNNTATSFGGAILVDVGGSAVFTNCEINDNTARGNGGAVYTEQGFVDLEDCQVNRNTSTEYDGGAIYVRNCVRTGINNCEIKDNSAPMGDGGAINIGDDGSQVFIDGTTITDNVAGELGGGIYVPDYGKSYIVDTSDTYKGLNISDTTVIENNKANKTYMLPKNYAEYTNLDGSKLDNDEIVFTYEYSEVRYHSNDEDNLMQQEDALYEEPYTVRYDMFAGAPNTFTVWTTNPDGTGDVYLPKDEIYVTEPLDLYRHTANIVTYDSNDSNDVQKRFLTKEDEPYTVVGFDDYKNPNGDTFIGYNTEADGSGTAYSPEDIIDFGELISTEKISADDVNLITLYAQWESDDTDPQEPVVDPIPPTDPTDPEEPVDPQEPIVDPENPDGGGDLIYLNDDEHIKYLIGYEDGTVRPTRYISRAEMATIFYRLLDNQGETDEQVFTDVDDDAWYSVAVNYLGSIGILQGYEDGSFDPDAPITRAEFATVAARFSAVQSDIESPFTDVDDDYWASEYINTAYANGWIIGYEDGTFKPEQDIKRNEASAIVNRMLDRNPSDETLEPVENPYSDLTTDEWGYNDLMEATIEHEHEYDENDIEVWTSYDEENPYFWSHYNEN